MAQVPLYLHLCFAAVTLLTLWAFYHAAGRSRTVLLVSVAWLLLQAGIALTGFFTKTDTVPPRFLLLIGPPLLLITLFFSIPSARRYLDKLDASRLTLLHTIRIPVELMLFSLFMYKAVPREMTFESRNLDILSGLTAPIIYYLHYRRQAISRWLFLAWNLICLALLINIVTVAILSAPFPFQKLAFHQPNIGVFYFPYIWLPGFIVPLVLLSHLVSLRTIFRANPTTPLPKPIMTTLPLNAQ